MDSRSVILAGGTFEPQANTATAVSFWHIPGGCDYANATAIVAYFTDGDLAKKFAKDNDAPPTMAVLLTNEELSEIKKL